MKTDNSRSFEEKFQEGYNTRCNELVHANLFSVGSDLYELTDEQRFEFEKKWEEANFDSILQSIALDYILNHCTCIHTNLHCYNK